VADRTQISFSDDELAMIDRARGDVARATWVRRQIVALLCGQNENRPAAKSQPAKRIPPAAPEPVKPAPARPAGPVRSVPASDARRLERPNSGAAKRAIAGLRFRDD
jgi:hypothetical protein